MIKELSLKFLLREKVKMKKLYFLVFISFVILTFTACTPKEKISLSQENQKLVAKFFDLTDKDGQEIKVTIGDVLYIKLTGKTNSGYQWNINGSTSNEFLLFKKHQVTGFGDPKILAGNFTDEWWLVVEKKGNFDLEFNYGKFKKEPESYFKAKIISE